MPGGARPSGTVRQHGPLGSGGAWRPQAPLDGGFVFALEPLAAALDGGDELREVDLEGVEDLVGVVLGAEADLPLAGPRVLDDVLGRALGLARDLLLADELLLALARLLHDPL